MNKWVRRGAWGAGAVVAVAVVAVLAGVQLGERRAQRVVQVEVKSPPLRSDTQALERGRYLYASRGCADCHGAAGTGRVFVQDGDSLFIRGANITTGPGGVVARYQAQDWDRTIRHGVAPGGRPLLVMPSEDYNRLTDDDLASIVAYVRSLPPGPGEPALVKLPLPARVLYGFGAIGDAASKIDHSLPPQQPVAEGVNLEHGRYVANMCLGCHGAQLAGGRIPGGPPDWPPAANLTPGPGTVMPRYASADAMLALFRSGKRPDGTPVKVMPFEALGQMSDTDVRALHLYLRSLPPRPQG